MTGDERHPQGHDDAQRRADVETRLQAAYQARAQQVVPDSLRPLAAHDRPALTAPTRPSPHRVRLLYPLLAAAAIGAVVLGTVAVTTVAERGAAPVTNGSPVPFLSSPAVSGAPSGTTAPSINATSGHPRRYATSTMLELGKVGTRADVPWGQVGSGWTLAVLSTTSRYGSGGTIYLVDPLGGRYSIGNLPANWSLDGWSPDGQRMLLSDSQSLERTEITLASGAQRRFTMPGGFLTYTRPRGLAIVVRTDPDGMARYGTDGSLQATYPKTLPKLGPLDTLNMLYTPDGADFVVGVDTGLALMGNGGQLVRALPVPDQARACTAARWVSDGVALATCAVGSGGDDFELFAVPIDGGHVTKLTNGPDDSAPLGYRDEWQTAAGTFGLATSGCGPDMPIRIGADGKGQVLDVPLPAGVKGRSVYVGHQDSTIEFTVRPSSCQGAATSLVDYDAASDSSVAVLGPGATNGSVSAVVPYPTDR